jgi:glycosyltransferase involved in cell wall biosynthesis
LRDGENVLSQGVSTSCYGSEVGDVKLPRKCGVPCIGTEIGGIPEVIEHGTNGYIAPLHDVESVACYALKILTNQDIHTRMRNAAIETVSRKFHSSFIVSQYEKIYEKAIHRHVHN